MGQVPTHVWVEEEGHKRRVKGKGKGKGRGGGGGEMLLGTFAPDCRHQWQSQKEQVKV